MKPQGIQKLVNLLFHFKDTAQNESTDKHFFEDMKADQSFVLNYSYERPLQVKKAPETQQGEYINRTNNMSPMNTDSEEADRVVMKGSLLAFQIWN